MSKSSKTEEATNATENATRPPGYVELDCPIQRGEQTITGITLRKPDAGSLRGIKLVDLMQMDVGSITTLLPRISTPTLTPHDITKLDPADLVAIGAEVVSFFLAKGMRESLPA